MADLDTALIVGFGAGVYFFFKGFRVYRECRILEDTPEMPIRSIPMGLVHIHGKACGDQLASSPVSHTPCFFYKVDIEKWKTDSQNRGSWTHYRTDANGVQFHLQDATGKVLIDAHRAEYDLVQTVKRETGRGSGFGNLLSGMGPPAAASRAGASDEALTNYAESLPASAGGGSVLDSLGQVALGASLNLGRRRRPWLGNSSRRYRFTEYCVLPEHWYDVTGTCVENPNAKDEHDRNLIQKGENEPTFLISWRAEREIEKTLRHRAALQVFCGAALSVACLGVLLKKLGWL
jgi:hypothetical protein